MLDWKQVGGCWVAEIDHDNAPDQLEIHQTDQFTQRECRDYGVDYEPGAKFGLYRVFTKPVDEYCLESLHLTVEEAKQAGQKYYKWFDSSVETSHNPPSASAVIGSMFIHVTLDVNRGQYCWIGKDDVNKTYPYSKGFNSLEEAKEAAIDWYEKNYG